MTRPAGIALPAALAALLAAGPGASAAAPLARITVEAGRHDRLDTPMSAAVEGLAEVKGPLRLEEAAGGGRTVLAAQVEPGAPPRLAWVLAGKTAAGATRAFDLVAGAAPDGPQAAVRAEAGGLAVLVGQAEVLRYNASPVSPPEGVDRKYARGAYLHPLRTPAGLVVTDDFPPDHLHQRGLWMSWTKTRFGENHPDFWNLGGGTGAVRSAGAEPVGQGPVLAAFAAWHVWLDLNGPGGEAPVLREHWLVRAWTVGGPAKGCWLVDLVSTQRCAGDKPLQLPKYFYGGLGFRGHRDWLKQVEMRTSEGKVRKDGNESKGRWVDVAGPVGGPWAGLLVMSHPANFRHPEPLRLHPQHPQICLAPSQEGDWAIEPGKDYVWQYRFAIHDGKMEAAEAERLWRDFAEPPAVRVTR